MLRTQLHISGGIKSVHFELATFKARYVDLTEKIFPHVFSAHAGILNCDAAIWWQSNTHRIPLTAEPFLSVAEPAGEVRDV